MDLWKYLKSTDKPKVIYGMGNGADKILSVFAHYGIECAGVFASDGFVRPGKTFHGMPVTGYGEICDRYNDFIVLVSFATSLPDVTANILRIAGERELYAPCVPVYGEDIFTDEYYEAHRDELSAARQLLCDAESRDIFDNIIAYRLSGDIKYLLNAESDPDAVWQDILRPDRYRYIADCGAYTGDTAAEFIRRCPCLEQIWALEADPKNYKKLSAMDDPRIIAVNKGVWSCADKAEFNMGAGRGAARGSKGRTVLLDFDSLDNILSGAGADYIKYDVEGSEDQALDGSIETIKKYTPDMLVSLYHRTEDIYHLILKVHDIEPSYRLYLRRFPYIPDWDINLYCIAGTT